MSRLREGPIALDTEADSYHHFREKVCLIQLSSDDETVLIDPLTELDLEPLRPVLESPDVLKVLHGADYDLRLLDRDFGLEIGGLFDTMIAARLVGERAFGLGALLETHLRIRLDKKHQLADWSQRPLPEELETYAAEDTRHLAALYRILEARLVELGRLEWAREEFRRLEGVRFTVEPEDPEAYRGVKGASRLQSRELAVLRELCAWRRENAEHRDVPLFRVATDAVLVLLAQHPPAGRDELGAIRGISRRLTRGRSADEILARVRRALEADPATWPEVVARTWIKEPPQFVARVRALRDRRDEIAAQLDLEGSILASRATLGAIVMRLDRGEDWWEVPELREWQIGLLAAIVA